MTQPTLLLVDPDDGARHALAALLRDAGYSVLEAHDAAEAVRAASERIPGLVIVDPWPSVEASLGMVDRLRSTAPARDLPVLALSTGVAPEHPSHALTGCTGYLEKPCPPERLLGEVRRILGPTPSGEAASDPSTPVADGA